MRATSPLRRTFVTGDSSPSAEPPGILMTKDDAEKVLTPAILACMRENGSTT